MKYANDRWIRSCVKEIERYCGLTYISKDEGEIVTAGRIDIGCCTYTKITFEI